ncbi:MAG TPA: hypothetical protein VGG39_32710 [Polyangiaceae bacterium]|jgi:hypothetical protein
MLACRFKLTNERRMVFDGVTMVVLLLVGGLVFEFPVLRRIVCAAVQRLHLLRFVFDRHRCPVE